MRFDVSGMCLAWVAMAGIVWAHGDVAPQPVDVAGLPELGEEWLTENPYRVEAVGEEVWFKAVQIGASGYNQNCARCQRAGGNLGRSGAGCAVSGGRGIRR